MPTTLNEKNPQVSLRRLVVRGIANSCLSCHEPSRSSCTAIGIETCSLYLFFACIPYFSHVYVRKSTQHSQKPLQGICLSLSLQMLTSTVRGPLLGPAVPQKKNLDKAYPEVRSTEYRVPRLTIVCRRLQADPPWRSENSRTGARR